MGRADCLLLVAFQIAETVLVNFRDANEGQNVLSVLLLDFGDCGESLSEFPVVVDVHGGGEFEGLLDGFQTLIDGGAFELWVVWHGQAASPVSIIA